MTLPEGGAGTGSFIGDGPIDAVFQAINVATGVAAKLSEFAIGAVTGGQDALGEVSVVLEVAGVAGAGQGVSTDIIDAAARAYVRALSVALARRPRDRAARGFAGANPDQAFNLKDLEDRFRFPGRASVRASAVLALASDDARARWFALTRHR